MNEFMVDLSWKEEVDAIWSSYGGSDIGIAPVSDRAYQALLDAGVGLEGERDSSGEYPSIRVNYPTSTNEDWSRRRYEKAVRALLGMVLRERWPGKSPYQFGSLLTAR